MKKPLDRISEAYFGELGEVFAEKVRSRVHWVCENAKGESVLDVGCSQGITSILLGREGKKVLGVDLLQEAIDFANENLTNEEEITKQFVEFRADNFMTMDLNDRKFDSIIFGEVLEHITDPQRFIQKAASLLNEGGSIIVTLPFGINDYFDHKKTYYMMDMLNFQVGNTVIQEIKFFGKWIGAIFKRKGEEVKTISFDEQLITQLENAFFTIEKDLWKDIRNRGQKIEKLDEKVKTLTQEKMKKPSIPQEELVKKNAEIESLKNQLLNKEALISNLKQENKIKDQEIKKLSEQEKTAYKQFEDMKKQVIHAKKDKIDVHAELLKALEKEEKLLAAHQKLLRKYKALSESKLGKLTLSYWGKRKRKTFGGK